MKNKFIGVFIALAFMGINYSQAQIYGAISGASPNTAVGIGISTPSQYAILDLGDKTMSGAYSGCLTKMNYTNSALTCNVSSALGDGAAWATKRSASGVIGMINNLTTIAKSSEYSRAVGGLFSVGMSNMTVTGGGMLPTEIAGVKSRLFGTYSGTPSGTIMASLYSVDEVNTNLTYAGYFSGRGYFTGKLGVGTANPDQKLDVENTTAEIIGMKRTGVTTKYGFAISSTSRFSIFDDVADVERLSIGANGNIGIGTGINEPAEKLEVNGRLKINGNILTNNNWISGDGENEGLYIDANGNLGINTIPNQRLTIGGGGNLLMKGYYNDAGDIIFETSLGGQLGRIWTNPSMETPGPIMYFSSGDNTPDLTITTEGNVAIGTTSSPNAKLTVDGKIICEEVEVMNVGADYVFDENYSLKSLNDVEKFIKANKHLPGILPAVDTEKGVNLGEFNEKLLEKIEELTLYIIEQNKKIEQIEQQMESLN